MDRNTPETSRTLLAVALSILVIAVWQVVFPPPRPPAPPPSASRTASVDVGTGGVPGDPLLAPSAPAIAPGEIVEVRTPELHAVFDTRGGALTSLELLTYPETQEEGSPGVDLVRGHTGDPRSLVVDLAGGGEWHSSRQLLFQADRAGLDLGPGEAGELVLTADFEPWGTVEKHFTFEGGRHDFDLVVRVVPRPDRPIQWAILGTSQHRRTTKSKTRWDVLKAKVAHGLDHFKIDDPLVDDVLKELAKPDADPKEFVYDESTERAPVRWAGFDEQYFLNVVLTDLSREPTARLQVGADPTAVRLYVLYPFARAEGEEGASFRYRIYAGPKSLDLLKEVDETLAEAVDFGMVGPLSRLFVVILKKFHTLTGNWGIAIILLTVLVRLLLFPLSLTSFKSMKKMQALQPQMTELREKLKDEPEKLNQEMMALYKREKVNPLGGCLPMVLQMPVFFGLYYALAGAIELRHAELGLWIHDLAAPDPYYVTPLLMGVTMWLQQKLTPQMGDPTQQKVMQFLPLIFVFFFLNFPSGLVLYWLFSNLFSIGQQWWIRRSV